MCVTVMYIGNQNVNAEIVRNLSAARVLPK